MLIVKICKKHGNLAAEDCYRYKDKFHHCKKCIKDYQKINAVRIKEKKKTSSYYVKLGNKKGTFQVTQQEYLHLKNKFKNKCAICKLEPKPSRRLSIDHNHELKKIRGLLCDNCNHGLGKFFDSIELLSNAIKYLKAANNK
jgi:hypothetical protein